MCIIVVLINVLIMIIFLVLWCLTPLSTIFQLYRGGYYDYKCCMEKHMISGSLIFGKLYENGFLTYGFFSRKQSNFVFRS
jgi:hypothetical protein